MATLSPFVFPRPGMPILLMRILQGIGTSIMDSGLGTLVGNLTPPGARAKVFGSYSVKMRVAGVLMPTTGEAIARGGGLSFLFGALALAVTAGLVTLRRLPQMWRRRQEEAKPVPELLKGTAPACLAGWLLA